MRITGILVVFSSAFARHAAAVDFPLHGCPQIITSAILLRCSIEIAHVHVKQDNASDEMYNHLSNMRKYSSSQTEVTQTSKTIMWMSVTTQPQHKTLTLESTPIVAHLCDSDGQKVLPAANDSRLYNWRTPRQGKARNAIFFSVTQIKFKKPSPPKSPFLLQSLETLTLA